MSNCSSLRCHVLRRPGNAGLRSRFQPTRTSSSTVGTRKKWSTYRKPYRGKSMAKKLPTNARSFILSRWCWSKIWAFKAANRPTCSPISPKRPRRHNLSVAEQVGNQLLSSTRIAVEHTLSDVRWLRIVIERWFLRLGYGNGVCPAQLALPVSPALTHPRFAGSRLFPIMPNEFDDRQRTGNQQTGEPGDIANAQM